VKFSFCKPECMPDAVSIFQVDAFTQTMFAGNPAGVVLGAEVLTDDQMQCIARELNNGDTAFVLPASGSDHDISIRFFTPRKEAAFVGHATLAAHAVLQRLNPRALRKQKGQTGIVAVSADSAGLFSIRQAPVPLGRTLRDDELSQVLDKLGLDHSVLDVSCPAQIAGASSTRLIVGLEDAGALDAIKPDFTALKRMSGELGAQGYFLFSRRTPEPGCDTEARMFCPALGIDEDPVSGNAHAMLGLYLLSHGLLQSSTGTAAFTGAQGRHAGRPGKVSVSVTIDQHGKPLATTIAGHAVIVFETQLEI
jgi:PhzF family phenazine biosynthesis protein